MPIEQIYFMYGFGVCFVFSAIVFWVARQQHKNDIEFHRDMRQLEVDTVREHWQNKLEEVAGMKGFEKSYDNGEKC